MPPPSERGRCGDCKFFDKKNVNGKPFGVVRLDASVKGEGGVCRGDKGLVLGMRSPDSRCAQPSRVFEPKSSPEAPQVDPKQATTIVFQSPGS